MNTRVIAPVITALAVLALAGCGSSDDSATTATSAVTVTRTVTPSATDPSTTAPTPVVTETVTSTEQPAPATTVANGGTSGSLYAGKYQRHESLMTLNTDGTGTTLQGANAADVETWDLSWQPIDSGIAITYLRLTKSYGRGLEGYLYPGLRWTAHFDTGETGHRVLEVTNSGTRPLIWCLPGVSSPECGA